MTVEHDESRETGTECYETVKTNAVKDISCAYPVYQKLFPVGLSQFGTSPLFHVRF